MPELHPPLRLSDDELLRAFDFYGWPRPSAVPVVVAVRQPEKPGEWNDLIGTMGGARPAGQVAGGLFYAGTADPGAEPMGGKGRIRTNPAGVARVRPGYYRSVYGPGYHHQDRTHPALRQDLDVPLPIERWDGSAWRDAGRGVGPFNLHRASWDGVAARVGDYSHGCLVVQLRRDHWNLLVALGYPLHGPTEEQARSMRWDLALIDWKLITAARAA